MSGPLSGLKILDFSALLPGPFATMILADLGADVLKVEGPSRPDLMRMLPPFEDGKSAGHMAINRNKKSIALDMKNPEASMVVKRLIKTYDIVLEQFRPGVMKRLGLDYETLKQENEKLIYCSLTGYGQTGPYKDRAGHDINYLAIAGIHGISGRTQSGPLPYGVQIADVGAGSYNSVVSILAAVIHRNQTGQGQYIDVSMTDGAMGWMTLAACGHFVGDTEPGYQTGYLNGGSFYDCYVTSDGRYMSVGSIEPQFLAALCKGVGREDLLEKQGKIMEAGESWKPFKDELIEIFKTKTLAEWKEIFQNFDACVEPVLTLSEVMEHPQTKARNMVAEVKRPDGTFQRQINSPFRFSKTRPEMKHTGPLLGEQTDSELQEIGFSPDQIQVLKEKAASG